MNRLVQKRKRAKRRKASIRSNIHGTKQKPRMSVFKSNKNMYVGIAAIVIIVVAIVLLVQKPTEVPETEGVEEGEGETATPEPTQEPEVTESGEVQYGSRGILSDVECEGKTISAIITNLNDETMTALQKSTSSDLHIQVKGINMQEFECDKEEIAPGDYTYCADLIGNEKQKDSIETV